MDGHINLLQPDLWEVGGKVSTKKGLFSIFIVVIVLVLGGFYFQDQKRGTTLVAEVESFRQQRDQLLRQVEAISSVTRTVKEASSQLDSVRIDVILEERTPWSHILREFSFIIPKGIWITEMKNAAGEGVRISGFSKSHKKVTEMMSSMETSPFFKDVTLEFSRKNTSQHRFDFSIHSGVRKDHSQGLRDG